MLYSGLFLKRCQMPLELQLEYTHLISSPPHDTHPARTITPKVAIHNPTSPHNTTTVSAHKHTDTQDHRITYTHTNIQTYTQIHKHTNKQPHNYTYTRTHRHIDTQIYRHIDKQIYKHTQTHFFSWLIGSVGHRYQAVFNKANHIFYVKVDLSLICN